MNSFYYIKIIFQVFAVCIFTYQMESALEKYFSYPVGKTDMNKNDLKITVETVTGLFNRLT